LIWPITSPSSASPLPGLLSSEQREKAGTDLSQRIFSSISRSLGLMPQPQLATKGWRASRKAA
jgi:hypothetical protein